MHYKFLINGSGMNFEDNRFIAVEYFGDSLWFVVSYDPDQLYRLGGDPILGDLKNNDDALDMFEAFNIFSELDSNPDWDGVEANWDARIKRHPVPESRTFQSLCSMEFYGLFLGLETGGYFVTYPPSFVEDSGTGLLQVTTVGDNTIIDMSTVIPYVVVAVPQGIENTDLTSEPGTSATSTDNQDHYMFLQQKGYLSKHRPCYMVTDNDVTRINRVTTEQKELITATSIPEATLMETHFTTHGSLNNEMSYPPQVLRYHIMSTMPGQVNVLTSDGTTTCTPTDFLGGLCSESATAPDGDYAKAVIWDLRTKDQVLQWQLDDCGDAVVNATMFEECDYALTNPNPVNDATYEYPVSSTSTASAA